MSLSLQEKKEFGSGNRQAQLKVLEDKLEFHMKVLKSASDIETLRGSQGAVKILEALIGSLD